MPLFVPKTGAVDWKGLKLLDVEALARTSAEEDAEKIEALYDMLVACEPGNALRKDVLKLFKVAQLALELKGEDNKQLESELLKTELALDDVRLRGGDGSSSEVRELQRQIEYLGLDLQHSEAEVAAQRDASKALKEKVEEKDELLNDLEAEYNKAQDDIRDLKTQLELQREHSSATAGAPVSALAGAQEELKLKNRQVNVYVEQLEDAHRRNTELSAQIEELTGKLASSVEHMEDVNHRVETLQRGMYNADTKTEQLQREKDVLQSQIEDLVAQASQKARSDDDIMGTVSDTVNQWKKLLGEKDAELAALQQVVATLQHELQVEGVDRQFQLEQALADKDGEIQLLNEMLAKATNELESAASRDAAGADAAAGGDGITLTVPRLQQKLAGVEEEKRRLERELVGRDKELLDLSQQLADYEQGKFGLHDAVQKIKDSKVQLEIRDADVARLTNEVNKLSRDLGDMADENEQLRHDLGLQPNDNVDIAQLQYRRNVELEQLRTTNRLLAKDVERLEAERLELKQKLLAQAMDRGARAVDLGLTADDLVVAEEFADVLAGTLSRTRGPQDGGEPAPGQPVRQMAPQRSTAPPQQPAGDTVPVSLYSDLSERFEQLRGEHSRLEERSRLLGNENASVSDQLLHAQQTADRQAAELKRLRDAVRELSETMAADPGLGGGGGGGGGGDLPAVLQLVQMYASGDGAPGQPSGAGAAQSTVASNATVTRLEGANAELRREVSQMRGELAALGQQLERKTLSVERLTREQKELKTVYSTSMNGRPLTLPSTMPASSADIIASQNEQLLQTLHELHLREAELKSVGDELHTAKREQDVLLHQQALLYESHQESKAALEAQVEKQRDSLDALKGQLEEAAEYKRQLSELTASLDKSPDELKRDLGAATRQATVLRINEKALVRRHEILVRSGELLQKENARLRRDLIEAESTVKARIGHLERHRAASEFTIASLQERMINSVDKSELDELSRRCELLATKYKLQLEQRQESLEGGLNSEALQSKVQSLGEAKELLEARVKQMDEKISLLTLQLAASAKALEADRAGDGQQTEEERRFVSHKLQTMEMQVTNERQRADLLGVQHEQAKVAAAALQERALVLERKFSHVTETNLALQQREKDHLDQLSQTTPREQHDQLQAEAAALRKEVAALAAECGRLRETSDVAASQADAARRDNALQSKEIRSIRQQLLEAQMASDDKATIGKLHHHIISLQMSEAEALRKYEAQLQQRLADEAKLLRTEEALERCREDLRHHRADARQRTKYLRSTLQALRTQYAGALTLEQQEKYTLSLQAAGRAKVAVQRAAEEAEAGRARAEDEQAVLQARLAGLEELMQTLQRGEGAARVVEWHGRLEEVRLRELRVARQLARSEDQCAHLSRTVATTEDAMRELEASSVRTAREYEDRQLVWERRETELETALETALVQREDARQEMERLTSTADVDIFPDKELPVAHQLEEALHRLRRMASAMVGLKGEKADAEKKAERADAVEKSLQATILKQKADLTDLKLRLNDGKLSLSGTGEGHEATPLDAEIESSREYQHRRQVHVARETIRSLQSLLEQKEQALQRCRAMVTEAHRATEEAEERHQAEYRRLSDKLLQEERRRSEMVGSHAVDALERGAAVTPAAVDELMRSIAELEHTVEDQSQALRDMAEKLRRSEESAAEANARLQASQREAKQERVQADAEQDDMEKQIEQLLALLQAQKQTNHELSADLERANEAATRAPDVEARKVYDKQRKVLEARTRELAEAKAAVKRLQGELVSEAESSLNRTVRGGASLMASHGRLEKETESMSQRLDALQAKLSQAQRRAKAAREENGSLKEQLASERQQVESTQTLLEKQAAIVAKLKEVIRDREAEVDRLQADEGPKAEVQALRRKVKVLEAGAARRAAEKDKPVAPAPAPAPAATLDHAVARWEAEKQTQKRLDGLKAKLREKDTRLQQATKQLAQHRATIERLDRDRAQLQSRLKVAQAPKDSAVVLDAQLQRLQSEVFALEEQAARDRQEVHEGRLREQEQTEVLRRLNAVAANLQRHVEDSVAEAAFAEHGLQPHADGSPRLRLDSPSSMLLDARQQNVSLKHELEELKLEGPRLRERIEQLDGIVLALKTGGGGGGGGSARKDARSGDAADLASATREIKQLRRKLAEAEAQSKQDSTRAVAKLATELDRTRDLLRKEREQTSRLSKQVAGLKAANGRLTEAVQAAEEREAEREVMLGASADEVGRARDALQRQISNLQAQLKARDDVIAACKQQEERLLARVQEVEESISPAAAADMKLLAAECKQLRAAERELQGKMRAVEEENEQLHAELAAFDPQFFEEIEDLKFNCDAATEKVVAYEKELRKINAEYGLPISVPAQ